MPAKPRQAPRDIWKKRIVGYSDVPIAQLKANPQNFRTHSKEQKDALRAMMTSVGVVQSVIVNRITGNLVDGHLRMQLADEDGQEVLPVAFVELSEREEKQVLATFDGISSMAGIDGAMLDDLLAQAQLTAPAINDLLSSMSEMASRANDEAMDMMNEAMANMPLTPAPAPAPAPGITFHGGAVSYGTPAGTMVDPEAGHDDEIIYEPIDVGHLETAAQNYETATEKSSSADSFANVPDELPGLRSFKVPEMFNKGNVYDIPSLRPDMLLDLNSCSSWGGDFVGLRVGPPPYLCNIGSASRLLDLSQTVLGFYTEDHKFDHFWNYPDRLASRIINARMLGAIVPNYTTTEEDSKAHLIWQTFRANYMGRFMQEAGIKIIPDVHSLFSNKIDADELTWVGIPKHAPLLAMQLQSMDAKEPEQQAIRLQTIRYTIDQLKPQKMLFYASKAGRELLASTTFDIPIIVCPTFMDHRRQFMADQKASVGTVHSSDENQDESN